MVNPGEFVPQSVDPIIVTEVTSYNSRNGDNMTRRAYGIEAGRRLVERMEGLVSEPIVAIREFEADYLIP
jgi:hypothetical protein